MKKSHLSRSNRKKLFAVETLEQRILLSADPVVAELVQQYHNANADADKLGALQVSASADSQNNLLKQTSQENAALNLALANAKSQDFALNTINVADFSAFQNANGQIVIGNQNSNAIINLGDAKTDDGKLAFNQNLLISNPQNGGEIFVDDDLVGGKNADLTINGSGHTTILSADISTAAGSNVTINDSLKISGARTIASGASIQLGSASNHFIDANSNGADSLTLTTATTGNVVIKGIVGGDSTNKLKSLTIGLVGQKAFNVSFDSEVTIDGDVTIYASGTVTFKSALNITNNGNLTIMGADLIVFENNVAVAGNIFLEGNEITLNGGQESVRTTGIGKTLTMRPTSTSYDISIGSPPAENTQNTLNITSTELFTLREGFSKIVIGHETTGHTTAGVSSTVYLGSKSANQSTFFDAVEIYGNKIQIDDFFNTDLKFQTKSTIKLDALSDITIKNEVKAFNSSTNLNQNISIYSGTGNVKQVANDGDTLSRESIIAADLTINVATEIDLGFVSATTISATNNSATGNITINSTAPTTVTTTITTLTPRTSGNITLSSDVNSLVLNTALAATTSGNISVKAGLLTVANTSSLAANGALTIAQAVSTATGSITLEAYSDLTLNNTVSTTGSSALSFKSTAGKILQNFDITSATGSAITLTAGDNIEMLDTKTISTTGTITLTAGNNVKLSILNSTTTVNVTATNGAILDNLTAETPNILGSTTSATLTAKTGIGAAGTSDINTTIANLTATNGATGGIFINETDALTIAGTGVKQDGGTGSIVITNASDNIITVDGDVNNTGSGHILIKAQDTLTLNRLVKSATGNISLLSDTNSILLSATGGIETTGTSSSIDIDAALAITMTGGSTIKGGGGNVRLYARAGNIALSSLDGKTGKVSLLTTNTYRILDNDTSDDIDVIAGGLRMNTYSVGQDNSGVINTIEIDTTDLSVYTTSSLFLTEATGLTVKTVEAITVKRVNVDGTTLTDQTDAAQSDLVSTTNGAIVLTATTGDIVIQDGNANNQGILANGSGNILINATTGNLRIEAPVNSGSGHINLLSGATLTQTAEGDVTSISGTIDVNATTAIVMADGAATQTTNQSIRYKAGTGDITLGYLATYGDGSSMGDIAIVAGGKIIDADTTGFDIRAKTLYFAANGIGTGENPLEITVDSLAAKADSGGMFLSQSAAITVDSVSATVFHVGTDGSTLSAQTESGSDLTTTGNGAIFLSATDIVFKDGDANGKTVSGQGSGNILLNASAGNLTFYGSLTSTSGNVSLLASKDVLINSATQLTTGFPSSAATSGNPSIDIQAGQTISMVIGSQMQTGNGNIRLAANGGNLTLGFISAGIGNVSLISTGKILDSNEKGLDIVANGLRIYASDVGLNTNPLEMNVTTLSALVYGTSGLFLTESDSVTISKIDDLTVNRVSDKAAISNQTDLTQSDLVGLNNGSLILSAPTGSITVLDGNDDGKGIESKQGGQILLSAFDTIDIEANVLANQGNISFSSTKRIVQTTGADVVTGGTIDYNALTTITIEDDAIISTQGTNIRLFATDSISFSGIDAKGGNVSLIAKNLLDSGDSNLDVIAKNLRINAGLGAGIPKNALDINVENVSAIASTGGVFLNETDGLKVTKLPDIAVKRVSILGEVSEITDAAQSNLTTTTGAMVLTTKSGDITVLEGKSDRKGIVTQSGNVLLNAAGNITLQATIENINAPIQLISGDTISQLENGYLLSGATIDVSAKNAIVMNAGALTKTSSNKDIRYQTTTGDITISLIDAGKGNVALLSGGKILDNFKSSTQAAALIASAANLTAGNAIGLGGENANPLEINVAKLTAKTGAGGAFITNSNSIAIDSVSVSTQLIDTSGIATAGETLTESDLKSFDNGSIILNAPQITLQDGDADNKAITLDGRGNLLLNASSAGIDINAAIQATSGNISLLATNANSKLLVNADILTSGNSSIDLEARGDIFMKKDVKISAEGNVRFNSGANITLSNLTTLESVSLIGDKILNGGGATNVSADALRINAGSLGTSDKAFATKVNVISASLTSDGLFLNQENALTISQILDVKINRVTSNGSVVAVIDKKQSDVVVEKGAVIIATKSGDITVSDGDVNSKGIVAGQGNILLSAAENLNIQAAIENTAGNISLLSGAILTQSATGNVTSSDGTIDVIATKGIVMSDGVSTKTSDQNMRYKSDGDISVNVLNAGKASILVSSNGTITNALLIEKSNVMATSLNISAKAVGSAEKPVKVALEKIAATAGSGGFFMSSAGDLNVDQVDEISVNQVKLDGSVRADKVPFLRGITTSENGSIVLSAANLKVRNLTGSNTFQKDSSIFASGTGNILLTASKGDLNLLSGVTSQKGSITLDAANTIQQDTKGSVSVLGNGSIDLNAKDILQAQTTKMQTVGGNMRLNADAITLGKLNAGKGNVSLIASKQIIDLGKTTAVAVTANQLRISALAVGLGSNPLDIKVSSLSAEIGQGGLFVANTSTNLT
ncbi:MAG: LEPR-XLL domain-containing protein, partial [Methylococcales bacterium]|nr:LEPR-XLL domain-containing protein [Methylococcales bacterium]